MRRLDLDAVAEALLSVEQDWPRIDAELNALGIGKSPFTNRVRTNMVCAYTYVDQLLEQDIEPFTDFGMEHMLELNHRVHFGLDMQLRARYAKAIEANIEKFNENIEIIANWYWRHANYGDHALKLAAETYVSILGQPQLFLEGNHRTGGVIASWINLRADYPPFVLSAENSIAYFAPSAEIKRFADRSSWRGRQRLPKYRRSFRAFWEQHCQVEYVLPSDGARPLTGD